MPLVTASQDPIFGSVQREMRRMMEQMQKSFFSFSPSEIWTPSINLYESDKAYIVCVDLSGVDKQEIELVVNNQKLVLRGARAMPMHPDGQAEQCPSGQAPRYRVHVMEIDHGPFAREVELPEDVDHEHIAATHNNGMLWIELPKKQ